MAGVVVVAALPLSPAPSFTAIVVIVQVFETIPVGDEQGLLQKGLRAWRWRDTAVRSLCISFEACFFATTEGGGKRYGQRCRKDERSQAIKKKCTSYKRRRDAAEGGNVVPRSQTNVTGKK